MENPDTQAGIWPRIPCLPTVVSLQVTGLTPTALGDLSSHHARSHGQVALAHCCARAPSEPCMRIPTHTAQASRNSGAGDSAPFFLMTPLIVRRWQVECTRRIQVSSGVSQISGSCGDATELTCSVVALQGYRNRAS